MRINENEITVIQGAVARHFSADARVYLFGSRVDDGKKGGDIDLLVESALSGVELQEARLNTMSSIQLALGDQKIDIVAIKSVETPESLIQAEAVRTGRQL